MGAGVGGEDGRVGERGARLRLEFVAVGETQPLTTVDADHTATTVSHGAEECGDLALVGPAAWNRLTVGPAMSDGEAGRESGRSRVHGFANESGHGRDLLVGGCATHGFVAHHEHAQRRVADVRGVVENRAASANRVEVVGERLELPRNSRVKRGRFHIFDLLHRANDEISIGRLGGGDGKTTVAGHHGGDTVEARRTERRVPEHLSVVVRVDVDEPGSDHQSGHVDDVVTHESGPDRRDAIALDQDVGESTRCAGSVDHQPTPKNDRTASSHGLMFSRGGVTVCSVTARCQAFSAISTASE